MLIPDPKRAGTLPESYGSCDKTIRYSPSILRLKYRNSTGANGDSDNVKEELGEDGHYACKTQLML